MSGFHHAEADRVAQSGLQIGRVTAIEGARVRVRIGDLDTQPLPVMRLAMGGLRLFATPSVGEQVVVAAPGGDMARAFVQGSLDAGNAPGDGSPENMHLDLGGGELRVTGGKIIVEVDVIADGVSLVEHVHKDTKPSPGQLSGEPKK
ncbi:MAG: phage baseplate assembly protein V [Rhodobacter sp.]|nr:phage baseplate assembly protein V [Rhodobacter sp.]